MQGTLDLSNVSVWIILLVPFPVSFGGYVLTFFSIFLTAWEKNKAREREKEQGKKIAIEVSRKKAKIYIFSSKNISEWYKSLLA